MKSDYLWDGSGEPDDTVAGLEKQLRPLKWTPGPLREGRRTVMASERAPWRLVIAATALIATATVGTLVYLGQTAAQTSWRLSGEDGSPSYLRRGQLVKTQPATKVTLFSEQTGRVILDGDTRLRVGGEERFGLEQGTMHALIWAPPAKFLVETPTVKAVDLGCEYTLTVAKDGSGFLTVEMGWVAFEARGLESFIPAGAACTTSRRRGPDTPHFLDARPDFVAAVGQFDRRHDIAALHRAVSEARSRDALTLWHLLRRTEGTERALVCDRLAQLVRLPDVASRDALLRGDAAALEGAWDALQLGDMKWWREWKRRWR